jgi:hypothetical protein
MERQPVMPVFDDPRCQDVWDTVRAMNDAWTSGHPERLPEFFHETMVAITPSDRDRRVGRPACVAGWKAFCDTTQIHHWTEIDPLVQVYGDAAVVTYQYDMSFDMNGRTIHLGGRDMFFFIREGGRWWAVADQFSPYPA